MASLSQLDSSYEESHERFHLSLSTQKLPMTARIVVLLIVFCKPSHWLTRGLLRRCLHSEGGPTHDLCPLNSQV